MDETAPEDQSHRGSLAILVAAAVAALLGLGAVLGVGDVSSMLTEGWASLQTMPPSLYFVAMALICVLPVPITPFYVAAAPLFGMTTALAWIAPAIVLNQFVAHRLTHGVLRPSLESLLARRALEIPRPRSASEETLLTALIRVTPGLPYAIQNWILGLSGVSLIRYLLVSWPIQMTMAIAWVVFGQSAVEGRLGIALAAIGVILAFAIAARWATVRLRASRAALDSEA